jgi:protein involved in polysaccharide export with SLBB domain
MIRIVHSLMVVLAISLIAEISSKAQNGPIKEQDPATEAASINPKAKSVPASSSGTERPTNKTVSKAARENARQSYKAGINYSRGRLFRQAMLSFKQAIAYDPEYAAAYSGLGHAYFDLGRYEEAIVALEKAAKLNPQAVDIYTRLGQAYTKLKEEKAALRTTTDSVSSETEIPSIKPANEKTPVASDPTQVYNVGIGDVLDIRIPGAVSNDSTLYVVTSSGQLDHPILGEPFKVLGLTTDDIAALLGAELKRRSIRDQSTLEVSVRDYNSHSILVSGLVKEPGTKIIRREAIPLYVVLADAQPLADAALVVVMSPHAAKSRTAELSDPEQTALLVRPGDVVTVRAAPKQFFYVGGNVKSPGEIPFRSGLTLTQAILSAGGVTLKGEKVQLTRGQGNDLLTMQEFKLKDINRGKIPDPLVEPGDRITVLP